METIYVPRALPFRKVAAPLSFKHTDISSLAADAWPSDPQRPEERKQSGSDRATEQIKMETGVEVVGWGSSFCHFWFGFGSLPLEFLRYKAQLRGEGERLNLTPCLALSTSLFPTLLHLFCSSHSIFLPPPPCVVRNPSVF